MTLASNNGKLILRDGKLGTGEACCCGGCSGPCPAGVSECAPGCGCKDSQCVPCSGPCDGENPCPEGCVCVDGECVPADCTGVIVGAYSGCQCWHAPENNAPGEDAAIACAQSACDQFWTPEYSQYACPEGYVITDCTLGPPQVDEACGGPDYYIVQVSVSCCPEENPLP